MENHSNTWIVSPKLTKSRYSFLFITNRLFKTLKRIKLFMIHQDLCILWVSETKLSSTVVYDPNHFWTVIDIGYKEYVSDVTSNYRNLGERVFKINEQKNKPGFRKILTEV